MQHDWKRSETGLTCCRCGAFRDVRSVARGCPGARTTQPRVARPRVVRPQVTKGN